MAKASQGDGAAAGTPGVTVSGHQMEVGQGLTTHVAEQIGAVAGKYFGGPEDAVATFSRGARGGFGCSLRLHAGRNLHVEGEGEGADAYAAFHQALERVSKQLRRRKRALREDKPVNPLKEGPG